MKIKRGSVSNMDQTKKADIIVYPHMNSAELVAGLLAIIGGVCIIARGAVKAGVEGFEEAEAKALTEIGVL